MPSLFCSFYGGSHMGVATDPISTQVITTSGTSAKTATAAPDGAQIVIVEGDAAHYVNVGPQDTVTASQGNGVYVGSGKDRPIFIPPGHGVAAITA